MKILRFLTVIPLIVGMLFIKVSTVRAFPSFPSSFHGTVKIDGANVPDGIRVSAYINGVQYAISEYIIYNGDTVYSLNVPGDDLSTPGIVEGGVSGDTVVFYVGSTQADQTAPWHAGTDAILNLTVTHTYIITASAGANGSISPFGAVSVNHGANQTFIISPITGYYVASVLVDDSLVGAVNSYTFTNITAGHSISATFASTPASATITLGNLNPIYDGLPHAVSVVTVPTGLPVHVTYNGVDDLPIAVGSYAVHAVITDPNYAGSADATMHILSKYTITLVQGWNLVSFNLHPISTAIEDVLSSLGSNYDLVYAWDATGGYASAGNWMRYAPGIPGNTLATLDETQGFWIRMTVADMLEITGSAPTTTDISLSTTASGWNLVGYPSDENRGMPVALNVHGVTDYSLVYGYHANDVDTWKRYAPGVPGNDLLELVPGWGYWIKVGATGTWDVEY